MTIPGSPGTTRLLIIALAAAAAVARGGTALAQSDRDLREENQRLQTQVNDLQRELDAARARIADMERELQALMRRLGGTSAPPPAAAPEERVTIDESVPNASPRALFQAVRESYADATRDMELGDFDSTAGSRQRAAYLRAVDSWAKRIQREMRSSVVWSVETIEDQGADEGGLRVIAVDPETKVALGDPFNVRLSSAIRHKLDAIRHRGQSTELVLKGVLVPQVNVNPNRIEPGPFDNPPLIGPFAEFNFVVTANSLTPPAK